MSEVGQDGTNRPSNPKSILARLMKAHPAGPGHASEDDCPVCALIVQLELEEMEASSAVETDCSVGVGGVTLLQMTENIKHGIDPYTEHGPLPRLEYAEHCGCCQRNRITMEVFGPSPAKAFCDEAKSHK